MDEISISNLNLNIFKTVIEYLFLMALLIEYFRDKKKKKIIDYHPGQKKNCEHSGRSENYSLPVFIIYIIIYVPKSNSLAL